jgi:hypothetical protein
MSEFILQPDVYRTGTSHNLLGILEDVWIRNALIGTGNFYILSGFGNYNGGVRFYSIFKKHIDSGGQVIAFFGGSTSQRLTSRQLVKRLLECGCDVHLVNRKKIFHTKCYGTLASEENNLVVTSGNFTGPGMTQNVESAIYLQPDVTSPMGFSWSNIIENILNQQWNVYKPELNNPGPAWQLLYDETEAALRADESQLMTMILTLGHADTIRINALPGTDESRGSQYFWLSKDCYDFFPPLTILNERGDKTTNSCLINLHYVGLQLVQKDTRVTFEAGNNVDFRLGTGKFRNTSMASIGDMAVISRISEYDYEIRIFLKGTQNFEKLIPYATNFIGIREKKIGYLNNDIFEQETGIGLTSPNNFKALMT